MDNLWEIPGKHIETYVELIMEIGFREREPMDSTVVEQLMESVIFWRSTVKQ